MWSCSCWKRWPGPTPPATVPLSPWWFFPAKTELWLPGRGDWRRCFRGGSHYRERVEAVGPLLDAIAGLRDAQVGLRLLRSCAGYGRLVHSMQCNPPHSQRAALQLVDEKVQAAFSSITGLHLTATQRAQVGRGLGFAGAGVRCSSLDAPAAFLASVGSCAVACEEADPAYVAAAVVLDPACTQATTALNAQLQDPLLDEASWQAQLAASSTTRQALLRSDAEPGARAFLVAKPGGVTRMETALFVTELRHRLIGYTGGIWKLVVPTVSWHLGCTFLTCQHLRGWWGKDTPTHSCAGCPLQVGCAGRATAGNRTPGPTPTTTTRRCGHSKPPTSWHLLA